MDDLDTNLQQGTPLVTSHMVLVAGPHCPLVVTVVPLPELDELDTVAFDDDVQVPKADWQPGVTYKRSGY